MSDAGRDGADSADATRISPTVRGRLFRKYVALVVAVVSVPLLANGAFGIWSSYRDHQVALVRLQHEQAEAAAAKIGQFLKEIETQLGWMTQLASAATAITQRRFEARLLLRQVPAIMDLVIVDANGREQLRVSRVARDVIDSQADLSREAPFLGAMARKVDYGPVRFLRESEPYMTLALAGTRREAGVSIADVNLKFIWDVVSRIKVGEKGRAYVVDSSGRLIAHPDISMVLRNTDFSHLAQVQAARADDRGSSLGIGPLAEDIQGRRVLTAHAVVDPLGWMVFVELPFGEAFAPVYSSLLATGLVLVIGLILALLSSFVLTRRMVRPIHELQRGAARIGAGALDHRIQILTGDELEVLGEQFNSMGAQLQDSYTTLERKVDERTQQLRAANLAKSRFLAAASHDLRQPLHALGLFVAQLHSNAEAADRAKIIANIDAAVTAMNELFNALLDISKLDADVLIPKLTKFPVEELFKRVEATFANAAAEKALQLHVVSSGAWVNSDFILLERVLLNLVSNAVRYTEYGGVVVGARRRGRTLRIEVWDSGIGIPENQRENVFSEFYQLASTRGQAGGGLGLGLAIVDRLCGLLGHRIELASKLGKGTRFTIMVPLVTAAPEQIPRQLSVPTLDDPCKDKLVVIIDDDPMVRDGMRGLLQGWGCTAVTAGTGEAALALLVELDQEPDVIISDYRLEKGKTGIAAINQLREVYGTTPAFLVSGDTAPEPLREATASGYYLLHKPVQPMKLRVLLSKVLKSGGTAGDRIEPRGAAEPATQESATNPSPTLPP